MKRMPVEKYRPYPTVDLPDRRWPSQAIVKAPIWCSVDLRDGNQALVVPMNVYEKMEIFRLLVDMGFKEIEIGFPSASQVEFDFVRALIEKDMIPADVTIQVLTQAREHLIKRTFESLRGARSAVVHMYNSTSELQRRVVFRMSKNDIVDIAVKGARLIKEEAGRMEETEIIYEYTPESFTGTEPEFAIEICEAVMDVWQPKADRKVILNLPSTVEMSTPNVYADRIEWFCRKIKNREDVIISVHPHNDRGTGVAAAELAVMAGAERVEGTLFGNGERTGNADILTLAMNLYSQGTDPMLDISDMKRIIDLYERCMKIPVHPRHPYAGELVYTAFSGSHQDAINKGMKAYMEDNLDHWEIPYLPLDPTDIGMSYESIIRINSQSGKGGVAYVMEKEHGFVLPKPMHQEFSRVIQSISERTGKEVLPVAVFEAFEKEYLKPASPLKLISCRVTESEAGVDVKAVVMIDGVEKELSGTGNGPIDAFTHALKNDLSMRFKLASFSEHALGKGSDSKAAAYIQIEDSEGKCLFGAGVDTNIDIASFKAILSALNRSLNS